MKKNNIKKGVKKESTDLRKRVYGKENVDNKKKDLSKKKTFSKPKKSFWSKLLNFFKNLFKKRDKKKSKFKKYSFLDKRYSDKAEEKNFNKGYRGKDILKKHGYGWQQKPQQIKVVGTVNFVSSQFAFIIPEDPDKKTSIYVTKIDLKGALHGDKVRVSTTNERWRTYDVGYVNEIISRANKYFVGTLNKRKNNYYVVTNGSKMYFNIDISEANVKEMQAAVSSRVKVKIIEYAIGDDNATGEIIKVIGPTLDHETEMQTILEEFDINPKFGKEAFDFVKKIDEEIPEEEYARRVDYRSVFTVTIDPVTAKDFDDAISIQKMKNGHYEIGVHIADVSYYLKEGSVLDEEAYKRNTSIYLVDRTIPMLPDKLCNNLCSLIPNKDRLAMSIIFEMDLEGKVYNKWIGETIIYSDERLTYKDSQDIIDKKCKHKCEEPILLLYEISKKLREERFKNGGVNFEFNNIEFSIDEKEQQLVCNISNELESHHLVEEFMLLANKNVANYAFELRNKLNNQSPVFVYRVHDCPEDKRVYSFNDTIKKYGYSLESLRRSNLPTALNNFLKSINDKPEAEILRQFAIRVMPKAYYTTKENGHFGLAFEHYSHFTSPIRRYPDVMVHRLLKKYLDKKYIFETEGYEEKCHYALEKEKEAASVERASLKLKQIESVLPLVGKTIDGYISNIYEWCIYVNLVEQHCEGMIPLSEVKDDILIYNREKMELTGKYSNISYKLGDKIKVTIEKCDIEKRIIQLNFSRNL